MPLFKLDDVFTYQDANDIKKLWAANADPAKAYNPVTEQYEDTGLYQDGEIWLDTANPPVYVLKRFNGTARDWESIADLSDIQLRDKVKDYFIRKDVDDTLTGTLTSTITNGTAMAFDNGHSSITVHDGFGNFNIKSGVDASNTIISTNGGSHLRMDEAGGMYLNVSDATLGSPFTATTSLAVTKTGVTINNESVWHAGNDGSGSGLDADKLDGLQSTQFIRADTNTNVTANTTWQDDKIAKFGDGGDLNIQHRANSSWIENTTGSLNISNYANGENINLTARNASGTQINMATLDPDKPALESQGAILSKMKSLTLANNAIYDTGIPRDSVGYIFFKHYNQGYANGSVYGIGMNMSVNNGVSQLSGVAPFNGDSKDDNKFNVYCESSGNVKIQNISGASTAFDYGFLGVIL